METGLKDKNGTAIKVGDTLKCDYGYEVTVYQDGDGFSGRLVCEPDHSCANIPYSLADSSTYTVV